MKKSSLLLKITSYIMLIAAGMLVLYPLVVIFMSSFKTMSDFMGNPLGIPRSFTFENYLEAWNKLNFNKYTVNSIIITGVSVSLICLTGAMAGYKLSRNFKGSRAITMFFLLGMAIPTQSFIITLFMFFKNIHLLSSYTGMIMVYTALNIPLSLLIFSGFFESVPKDLLEAPLIDGCTELRMFFQILLPISRPVIGTVVILSGMSVWNDFFIPLMINMDPQKNTLPTGLVKFKGETAVNWTPLFAAIMLIAIPIIILFLLMQKQFVKGLTSGAVKG